MRQFSTSKGTIKAVDHIVDNSDSWVILFHGFGADAYDLSTLQEVLVPGKPSSWLFPQGILEVSIGPGWTGRAWWKIDMATLQKRQQEGQHDMSAETPEIEKARDMAFEMIAQLKVPWSNIILGGFSQGAMLATDLFLRAPETPKGLVLFSPALINKEKWKPYVSQRQGRAVFYLSWQPGSGATTPFGSTTGVVFKCRWNERWADDIFRWT